MTPNHTIDVDAYRRAAESRANNGTVGACMFSLQTEDFIAILDRLEKAESAAPVLDAVGVELEAPMGLDAPMSAAKLAEFNAVLDKCEDEGGLGVEKPQQGEAIHHPAEPSGQHEADSAEIIALHGKLAHEKLRADQGWERYESANRNHQAALNALQMANARLAELTVKPSSTAGSACQGGNTKLDLTHYSAKVIGTNNTAGVQITAQPAADPAPTDAGIPISDERVAFEAYMGKHGWFPQLFVAASDGSYQARELHNLWSVWQARGQQQAGVAVGFVAAVRDMLNNDGCGTRYDATELLKARAKVSTMLASVPGEA